MAATFRARGIDLNMDWRPGRGILLSEPSRGLEVPAEPGLYAIVHHASHGVRIGETGQPMRGRFRQHCTWHRNMVNGTARSQDYRRLDMSDPDPYMVAAARDQPSAFEHYVLSTDPRLADKIIRQNVERDVFAWVRAQQLYVDWNRQRAWH